VRFVSFLSGEFINVITVNPTESKLTKCTSLGRFEGICCADCICLMSHFECTACFADISGTKTDEKWINSHKLTLYESIEVTL
jgi:hypothetical protein